MKNLKNCLLLLFVIGIFASSCKKDDGASTTELLTNEGGWTWNSFSDNSEDIIDQIVNLQLQTFPEEARTPELEALIKTGIMLEIELSLESALQPCDEDDAFVFNSDGTVTVLSGDMKCSSSEPDEADGGTWALSNNDSQLTLTDALNDSFTYSIGSISSSKMELEIRQNFGEIVEEEEADFSDIEAIDGYDDLIKSDVIYTIEYKAN